RKMVKQGVAFDEVYDKFAIRIIYETEDLENEKFLAWKIYSIVTDHFHPKELLALAVKPKVLRHPLCDGL
ncbi:MAG: hypothetical protein QMB34_07055, partial [Paracoccaceae bacterium]